MRKVKVHKPTYLILREIKVVDNVQIPDILTEAVEAYAKKRGNKLKRLANEVRKRAEKAARRLAEKEAEEQAKKESTDAGQESVADEDLQPPVDAKVED